MPLAISAAWGLIPAPLRSALLYAVGGLAIIAAAFVWLHFHDANIRSTALTGYVAQAELTAANAKAAEAKRQASAAASALDEYQRRLAAEQINNAVAQGQLEAEISDYEKTIGDDSRCTISDRDRDWLLGHVKPKA